MSGPGRLLWYALPGLTALLVLFGCASGPVTVSGEPPAAGAASPSALASPGTAAPQTTATETAPASDFSSWRAALRVEALGQGISPATFDAAFTGVEPIPRILELDSKQAEFTLTFQEYAKRVVTDQRVALGRRLLKENEALLREIGGHYGVQPRFIVALWGIESGFGSFMGGYPVIASLSTLAYNGRRAAFFRKEALNALRILENGDITPERMKGSWAGAMGQSQFMPSSYLKYAVDWNKDGTRDIWGDRADVFASIANYLSTVGWNADQTWGRGVTVPAGGVDPALVGMAQRKSLADWKALGIKRDDGGDLPVRPIDASLIQVKGPDGPFFLIYDNFRTIMDWNKSFLFATTVGMLADRIGDGS